MEWRVQAVCLESLGPTLFSTRSDVVKNYPRQETRLPCTVYPASYSGTTVVIGKLESACWKAQPLSQATTTMTGWGQAYISGKPIQDVRLNSRQRQPTEKVP